MSDSKEYTTKRSRALYPVHRQKPKATPAATSVVTEKEVDHSKDYTTENNPFRPKPTPKRATAAAAAATDD